MDTKNIIRIDDARTRLGRQWAPPQRQAMKRKRVTYENQHTGPQCLDVLKKTRSIRKAARYHPGGEDGLATVLIEAIFGGKQAA